MAFEDFTTYTKVDPGADITVAASKITAIAVLSRQDTFYVYKDMGVDYFAEGFIHRFEIEFSGLGNSSFLNFYMLANSVNDLSGVMGASEDCIAFSVYDDTENLRLRVIEAGGLLQDVWVTPGPQPSTTYFITITRDDDGGVNNTGQVKAFIRTGSHGGALQDTLSIDCSVGEQNDYRYIYGCTGFDDNVNANTVSGFTQNMDLAPFEVEVVAGVGLGAEAGTLEPEVEAGVGLSVSAEASKIIEAEITAGVGVSGAGAASKETETEITASVGVQAESTVFNWSEWLAIYGNQYTARYYLTLTGAPDSLADVVIPISSFQYRLRDNTPSYLQVVIPGIDYATDIANRANGDLIVEMSYLVGGVEQHREQLARVDLEDVQTHEGPRKKSIVLVGHRTETWGAQIVTLRGITYQSDKNGLIRIRCAEPDLFLRPGNTVKAGDETFTAGQVMTAVAKHTQWMEVVEAA